MFIASQNKKKRGVLARYKHKFCTFAPSNHQSYKMLIGRTEEKRLIMEAYHAEESHFVAIYGRRRVGKTYLVRELFEGKFTFEHSGMANTKTRGQLQNFQSSLRRWGLPKARQPHNWIEAFDMLCDLIAQSKNKRKVVFIDELPWMDAPKSDFLPAFEHFWNGWASSRKDVLLIVCGSATSWIISNIVNNHGGLHNRLTYEIPLRPFTLQECRLYAQSLHLEMNAHQLLECYMVMGGVPYYWSRLQKGLSLAQNIDALFFSRNGGLRGEYQALYSSLFRRPELYQTVIMALGQKRIGMTRGELMKTAGLTGNGTLTRMLEELEQCGFIRRYNSAAGKANNAIFQLIDSFTLFYFKFMQNNVKSDEHFWTNSIDSAMHRAWSGLAFERVCLMHIPQLKRALGIEGVTSFEYAWRSKASDDDDETGGAQIDLLIERNDQVTNLCEMKFCRDEFEMDEQYYKVLQNKKQRFISETGTKNAIHLTLVTVNGIKRNSWADEIQSVITAKDLF